MVKLWSKVPIASEMSFNSVATASFTTAKPTPTEQTRSVTTTMSSALTMKPESSRRISGSRSGNQMRTDRVIGRHPRLKGRTLHSAHRGNTGGEVRLCGKAGFTREVRFGMQFARDLKPSDMR